MTVTVKVRGIEDLRRKLRALKDALDVDPLRVALKVGAFEIMTRAKELAPKLTGNLARSIHVEDVTGRAAVKVGTDVEYAPHQEFGTSRGVPPHPYMRPAFDERQGAAVSSIERAIRALVERAAR